MELIIDYELLSKLYKDDPEEFEHERKRLLESYFDSLPEERQLKARQIQWQIEAELRKYKDPIARMNRMVELFWEQTFKFRDTIG
jgi:hypothetical protein